MPEAKYRFNAESLNYEKIELSLKKKLLNFLTKSGLYLASASALIFALSFLVDLPKDIVLKRENQLLITQYSILQDNLQRVNDALKSLENRDDDLYRLIFEAEPIPDGIRKAGFGGSNRYSELLGYNSSDLVIETSRKFDIILNQLRIQSESYDDVLDLARDNIEKMACVPNVLPVEIKSRWTIGSGFQKSRLHPIYNDYRPHYGQDFHDAKGSRIFATGNGTVKDVKIRPQMKVDYGTVIYIEHGYGYETVYAHLNKVHVKKGDKVVRGQHIADMGSTGGSRGPHLHYEVHLNKIRLNPVNFFIIDFTPSEFANIIERNKKKIKALD